MTSLDEGLARLNPVQRSAIEETAPHILVSAGAGTGKTSVLTLRYGHLVHRHNVDPHNVMAVTFTNKAAQEMKHRLQQYFSVSVHQLWIGTFHALAMRILRRHSELIDRTASFTILDRRDQEVMLAKILKEKEAKKQYTTSLVLNVISAWKQDGLFPEQVMATKDPFILSVYRAYFDRLKAQNAFDFDDLLLVSCWLFSQHPEVLGLYHAQFQHILVDEYQDVNSIQHRWLKLLAKHNIFCVGDDDQSIYGWRGADVEKILRFSEDFPHASVICLEQNYRSTSHILRAASHLIGHNGARFGKVLHTDQAEGEKIKVQGLWDTEEEAAFITKEIMARQEQGVPLSEMAILVRTGAQTREFEERFMLQKIPYHLVGNTKFYDRQEIRDFLCYLRVIHSPLDNLAFERIINVPRRGLGNVALQAMHDLAEGNSLEEAARLWCETMAKGAASQALGLFLAQIDDWRACTDPLPVLAERILEESGYIAMWKAQGPSSDTRIENLKELVKALSPFSSVAEFLEHVSLLLEVGGDAQQNSVSLMTLHAAKGLEFDTVFLPGWEENVFPHIRAIEEHGKKGVEEERRLAYVGLTRARKTSCITFCWNRRMSQGWVSSSPSRFIEELPKESVDISLRMTRAASQALETGASGQRVSHTLFGMGTLQNQIGHTANVLFDTYGQKRVLAHFLTFHTQTPMKTPS